MCNTTNNHEHEHFPCCCHRPEYAYTDTLCPMCEEAAEREREARREEDIQALEEYGYDADEDYALYWDQHAEG
jgi:hypothetical protein